MRRRHRPARVQQRLSRRHESYLYLTSALLLISGAGWLVGRYLLRASGVLGDVPHPSEVWWLRLHGAAVIVFLAVFGALLPGHVVQNWRRRVNRYSGVSVVSIVVLLALSGYGLYYVVDDRQRALISVIHWAVGLAAAGVLALHVVLGKRLATRAHERRVAVRQLRPKADLARPPYPGARGGEQPPDLS
jgi:uncharacterized membrane protein